MPKILLFILINSYISSGASLAGQSVVKNLPANTGNIGSTPRSGRYSGEGNGNPLQYSPWELPWTEEPGGLQFMESQKSRTQLSD